MPRYEIEIPHGLSPQEVRTRLEGALPKLEDQYGAKCAWDAEGRLLVTRKGLEATVHLEPGRLRVDMNLAFLLAPLAGSIRTGITKQLTELLA